MKNERGSIIMVAIPLLAVLFISIGIYVYNSASHIERSLEMPYEYETNNYIYDNDSDYDFGDEDTDNYSSYFDLDI